ncbi:acylneuraminate cytidylyltransferase family protein [Selenomonas ruminis]|uniref:Acylneuraminate cytidylyltransferase family protein n=1 Tax=Selenomonas ruminis TaxID=2593411 RepID=A0A5D6W961_9FIRM|nr:acylneuraminate cytidylyltransferase family protein [Selenomonas sp. mPRGC5]TYZ24517.1 acylneuraminate cytidylyltransferase family protein [Selenomonas sp. mPRGC5]
MKNIAIIPARSGSKGLKDKNIKLMDGKPMLAYSIDAAKASGLFDEVMVSTDSQKYADIAVEYGASVPFLRSAENSSDNASSWDTVLEVIRRYRDIDRRFDTVCLLQPTSPLRTGEDIVGAYKVFQEKNVNAVTSVCEVDHSPLWTMTLDEDGMLTDFRYRHTDVPRQNLEIYYRINGAIYIRQLVYGDAGVKLEDDREIAFIMDKIRSIDIDDKYDFALSEYLMKRIKYNNM